MKIQSLESLETEMRAVARGEKPAPADAAEPSCNSAHVLATVLALDDRGVPAGSRDQHPQSVAKPGKATGLVPNEDA